LNLSLLIEIAQVLEGLAHLTPFFFLLLESLPSEYLKEGMLEGVFGGETTVEVDNQKSLD
jgi:hypothetical protein